ncbi:uncharacterized protein AB675_6199 [Cyphellophora attinorum]|uniref:Uncharacterized protein n=1 Tax=Cyphellophora attinorum TaxID=1664694 RepID=A0A0N0NQG2_9EURO|nr:uncharacterized protein AB675_6199 [Phialophora attinorum]KPI43871.1 hypothetical protein AB675_6199 [Phialophora attinorum]
MCRSSSPSRRCNGGSAACDPPPYPRQPSRAPNLSSPPPYEQQQTMTPLNNRQQPMAPQEVTFMDDTQPGTYQQGFPNATNHVAPPPRSQQPIRPQTAQRGQSPQVNMYQQHYSDLTYGHAVPAPVRQPTYHAPAPAPVRQMAHNAQVPAPIQNPTYHARAPAPVRQPSNHAGFSTAVQQPRFVPRGQDIRATQINIYTGSVAGPNQNNANTPAGPLSPVENISFQPRGQKRPRSDEDDDVVVTRIRSQRPIVVYDDKENIDDELTFLEARTLDREASTPGVLAATPEPTQLPSPPGPQGQQKRAPTGARNKSWYKVDTSKPCELTTALATGLINTEQRNEERKKENLRLRGGTGGRQRGPRRSVKWPEMSPEIIAEQEMLFSDERREENRAWKRRQEEADADKKRRQEEADAAQRQEQLLKQEQEKIKREQEAREKERKALLAKREAHLVARLKEEEAGLEALWEPEEGDAAEGVLVA